MLGSDPPSMSLEMSSNRVPGAPPDMGAKVFSMNTCVVLGAGASLANALHFHKQRFRDLRPPLDTTFFETVDARNINLSPWIRAYLRDFLGIDPIQSTLREHRMEEVFKDVSYDFRETPDDKVALNAYIDLVDLYLRVLRETTNWLCDPKRKGAPIGRLLDAAAKRSDKLTIITFNHDLVIENEIERRKALRSRWCLDEGYGSVSKDFTLVNPGDSAVPLFRIHGDGECDHDRPITLLKLHGSLNWVVRINSQRPTSRFLKTGGGGGNIHLSTRQRIESREIMVRHGSGRTRWQLWPVVVPPIYAKQSMRAEIIQKAWIDARSAIESADRMLFFGYSLPGLDVEAEKTVERSLLRNKHLKWVDVVNPAPSSAGRFASVSPSLPIRWYPALTDFLDADGFKTPDLEFPS